MSYGASSLLAKLGRFLERSARYKLARRFYLMAERVSGAGVACLDLPNMYYKIGEFNAAVELFRCRIDTSTDPQMLNRYAISLERSGDSQAAIATYRGVVDIDPDSAERWRRYAGALARAGHTAEAHAAFKTAYSIEPSNSLGEEILRTIDVAAPAWKRADCLSYLEPFRRTDLEWLRNYARVLGSAGRNREKCEALRAVAAQSKLSADLFELGYALDEIGATEDAKAAYEDALSVTRNAEAKKWGLGTLHAKAGRPDRAVAAYTASAKETSEVWRQAGLWFRAGTSAVDYLDFENARQCFRRACSLRPGYTSWAISAGAAEELAGEYQSALSWYQYAGRFIGDVSSESLRVAIARCLNRLGRFEESTRSALPAEPATRGAELGIATSGPEWSPSTETLDIFDDSSSDYKGLVQRARIAQEIESSLKAANYFDRAFLVGSKADAADVMQYARLLESLGRYERASEVLLFHSGDDGLRDSAVADVNLTSYQAQVARYLEWRQNMSVHDGVVLYESNLGLSVDCNPLEVCRAAISEFGQRLTHIWAVKGSQPLPDDLLQAGNVFVIRKDSDAYVRLLATAKYLVNNSTFPTYFTRRSGQTYLMTWHGTPLKTLGKRMPEILPHANMARNMLQASAVALPNQHTFDALVGDSDIADILADRCWITGHARVDPIIRVVDDRGAVLVPGSRILVAPTWREDAAIGEQVDSVIGIVQVLEGAGLDVAIRAHHYVEDHPAMHALRDRLVSRRVPTNDLLPVFDALVTDYSSIYFDFAASRRPIFFYIPDWEQYVKARGTYFGQEELPGVVAHDLAGLESAVLDAFDAPVIPNQAFIDSFLPMEDGESSRRTLGLIFPHVALDCEDARPVAELPKHPTVIIRQSMIPNGMSSSMLNLTRELAQSCSVKILTEAGPLSRNQVAKKHSQN